MMWRSMRSFSRIATPLSIKIGGGVASKFDLNKNMLKVGVRIARLQLIFYKEGKLYLKSGGGLSISTVVIFKLIVLSSAKR